MSDFTQNSIETSTIKKYLRTQFNQKDLQKFARQSKLVQRSTSTIKGHELLNTLLESALDPKSYSLSALCDTLIKYNPLADMTKQGISQRINTPECVKFLELIYTKCLSSIVNEINTEIGSISSKKGKSLLNLFDKVLVIDSTEFPLHPSLKDEFKGSGGPKENASCMKICAIYEAKIGTILSTEITDRNSPDQGLGSNMFEYIKRNDLAIFDLGFFSFDLLDGLQKNNAFFISRLHGGTNIYRKNEDTAPLEVGKFIEKRMKKNGFVDENVFLTAKKLPIRIVAFELEEKSYKKRLKEYCKRCRKDKRKPSEENLSRMKYAIFITNVGSEDISDIDIAKVYRLRWQIELIFKNWKSQLNIDYLSGKDPSRIKCLILSRLIAISIIWVVCGYVGRYLEEYMDEELSLHKSINWLKHKNRFERILRGNIDVIFLEFLKASKWLYKESTSKRQTTKQLLENWEINDFLNIDNEDVMNF